MLDDLVARRTPLGPQILANGGLAPFVNVYLGGEDVRTLNGLETAVATGDTVILLPAMAGGASRPWSPPVAASVLELVGSTPLVELRALAEAGRAPLREARGPEPHRLDQGPRREGDDRGRRGVRRARARPGAARADLRQHRASRSRWSRELKGYPLTCVMPENATEERKRLLRLYGAEIVSSPAEEGSNGAVRLALEMAERDPRWFVPFQYANPANVRAHYEGTGAEIADRARPRRRPRRRASARAAR